ncbi:MAG: tRNA (adenosine(37)-N6)-dimethylallyltransferase MiaA [Candidatus Kerfeldbacteria bacterium]|nr:tRNA (adenosine(37)-N6)-dimethylallyltransferase MiaA [Candidatus Kerfeldbacteria bacterium]
MVHYQWMKKRRIIIILGPTASGKSALGVKLAKKFHGVVLSADSRQVYKGLDVGTAKITKREMRGVPHFLIDITSPKRTFTVAQFQRAAQRVLKRIPTTTPVFVVGGSAFYIEAILNPRPFPKVKPNPKLRRQLEQRTAAQLFSQLRQGDPRRAAAIDQRNKRRLIRALEIVQALGHVPARLAASPFRALKLGITMPRHQLYKKIDSRIIQRLPGMLKEVKKLKSAGLPWKRLESFGLEYRWLARVRQNKVPPDEAIAKLQSDSHAFVRRQLTWWRRDRTIRWIRNQRSAEALVHKFLVE